jgi:hypothetical protein
MRRLCRCIKTPQLCVAQTVNNASCQCQACVEGYSSFIAGVRAMTLEMIKDVVWLKLQNHNKLFVAEKTIVKALVTIFIFSLPLFADNPVLRVKRITKASKKTEVELQPMLTPYFSAYVENGTLKEGEVIRCEPKARYTGKDDHGAPHYTLELKCGDRVLLLKAVTF